MIDIYCFILALGSARSLVRIHLSPLLCFLQTSFRGPKSRLELTQEVLYRVKNAFNLNLYVKYASCVTYKRYNIDDKLNI